MSQTTSSDPKSLTQAEPSVARPSVLVWSGVLMQMYLFVVVGIAAKRIWQFEIGWHAFEWSPAYSIAGVIVAGILYEVRSGRNRTLDLAGISSSLVIGFCGACFWSMVVAMTGS